MKEHPIIFSSEMVRAILDGRKTQTRRIIMPQPEDEDGYRFWWKGDWDTRGGPRAGVCTHGSPGNGEATWTLKEIAEHCSYGQVGDRLWVREGLSLWPGTVAIYLADDEQMPSPMNPEHQDWLNNYKNHRVPSIHMPKWAARIFLEITNIRVERVQDISWQDCKAEGITLVGDELVFNNRKQKHSLLRTKFNRLWDSLNAKRYETIHHADGSVESRQLNYGWDKNPFVWVIEFKRKENP